VCIGKDDKNVIHEINKFFHPNYFNLVQKMHHCQFYVFLFR